MAKLGGTITISGHEFEEEVLRATEPVLVDFTATWCGPCRALAPVLDELARDLAGRLKIVKLDVDQATDVASQHQVSSIPCLVVFKGGREVTRIIGAIPKKRIAGALELALAA